MQPLARHLEGLGYMVVNLGYPSRRHPVETLARMAIPPGIRQLRRQGVCRIHAVTHSMGGLLLRAFLALETIPEMGRAVLLCPPNQGSELVDLLRRFAWFRHLFGPAFCQLGTGPQDLPTRLGPAPCLLGVLTGNRPAPGLAHFFPGPNDGKVSVARAQLAGMADLLVVPYGHALIMRHGPVLDQVAHFLAHGHFRRPN